MPFESKKDTGVIVNLSLGFLILSIGACSTRSPVWSNIDVSTYGPSNSSADEEPPFLKEASRLEGLKDSALFLLELEPSKRIRMIKPTRSDAIEVSQMDELLAKFRGHSDKRVVVQVPPFEVLDPHRESDKELAIDIDGYLRKAGFSELLFLTTSHGFPVECFPNGLPTKDQARRERDDLLRLNDELKRRGESNGNFSLPTSFVDHAIPTIDRK